MPARCPPTAPLTTLSTGEGDSAPAEEHAHASHPHALLWTAAVQLALISNAGAVPVGLATWTAEPYPAVAGFPAGNWQVAGDSSSVTQTENGQPTVFFSDFSARNTTVTGTVEVLTAGDDDYIGFVLGFEPGDSTAAGADHLLVDWKRATQAFDFTGLRAPTRRPAAPP